jgi:hypothetical protein
VARLAVRFDTGARVIAHHQDQIEIATRELACPQVGQIWAAACVGPCGVSPTCDAPMPPLSVSILGQKSYTARVPRVTSSTAVQHLHEPLICVLFFRGGYR